MRKRLLHLLVGCVIVALALIGCDSDGSSARPPHPSASPTGTNVGPNWGKQSKTSGCMSRSGLQDKECTPGAIIDNVSKEDICKAGYTSAMQGMPQSLRNQVFAEYGIKGQDRTKYEIDHLVSLDLGGSNAIANLWPQALNSKPGFHEKDRVESFLHSQVCAGTISLQQAQSEIATDWLNVYEQMPKG